MSIKTIVGLVNFCYENFTNFNIFSCLPELAILKTIDLFLEGQN